MRKKKLIRQNRLNAYLRFIIRSLTGILVFILLTGLPLQPQESAEEKTRSERSESIPEGVTPKETVSIPVQIPENLPSELKEKLSMPFSLELRTVDVPVLLDLIRKKYDLNIVATKSVSGKLTILLKNVSVYDTLEIILLTNGLAKEVRGNIINIMTEAEYQALYGDPYNEKRQLQAIKLTYMKPSNLSKFIENLKSRVGRAILDDATLTVILMDVPEKLKQLSALITELDVLTETRVFELKYGKVDDVEPLVTKGLTPDIGSVKADKRMARLIVTDTPSALRKIEQLIRAVDARPRQVLIEAKMVQIQLTDKFSMGVEWQKLFSSQSRLRNVKLIGTFPILPSPKNVVGMTLGELSQDNYTATVQALQELGNTKLISAPRLVTLSDKEAVFMVGSREAYATTTVTQTEAAATTAETIQFIDVGITLRVTPSINEERFIVMKLKPEISQVVRWETTAQGNRVPIVQTSNAETNVLVKDGVTIVIAGLIKDNVEDSSQGIPIISQLPLIGGLFKSNLNTKTKSETVIFLTPYIVTGEADTSVITKQEEMIQKQPKDLKEIK